MTIIQVVQHLSPGGIEVMAVELKKYLNNIGNHRVLIVSLEGEREEFIDRWPKLKPIANDVIFLNKNPGFSLLLIFRLIILFFKYKADVIHTHHIGPLIYAGLAARLSGIRTLVHTEHDAWHLKEDKSRKIQRKILSITKPKLVADADAVAKELKTHIGGIKVSVIKNGVDIFRFVPGCKNGARIRKGLPVDKFLIGASGRLEEVKGHNFLLKAIARLNENVHLVLAGDGSLRKQLQDIAVSLGVEDRVHFLGHVEDMPLFYQALDVFCLPSLQEGMPLAPLEAQACGIPAVVSDTGATRETLYQSNGGLVAPGDSKGLASVLMTLLIQKSGPSPRQFVKDNGNVVNMVKGYLELYQEKTTATGEVAWTH